MDKENAAADIIAQALPLAPFEGWNLRTLNMAARTAGYRRGDVIRIFPGGAIDAAQKTLELFDKQMTEQLRGYHLDTMKIRQRIATAIRLRLEIMAPHREGVRKILALMAIPYHCPIKLRQIYHTVDTIWYEIGDTSTDFNFYTKRLMLAGVYSATLLHWLDDRSQGYEATWAFLDRRINDVMIIEKAKQHFKSFSFRDIFSRHV